MTGTVCISQIKAITSAYTACDFLSMQLKQLFLSTFLPVLYTPFPALPAGVSSAAVFNSCSEFALTTDISVSGALPSILLHKSTGTDRCTFPAGESMALAPASRN